MSGKSLRLPYKTKKFDVTKENISWFDRMEHARPLRENQVGALHGALQRGEHFDAALVVNHVETGQKERFRLIDGNHRMEAIKRWVKGTPGARIEVLALVYENLDEDAERAIFEKHNKGTKASLSDRIHVTQEDFPIYAMLRKDFPTPVTIRGPAEGEVGITFLTLARAHIARTTVGTTGVGGKMDEVLARIKRLDHHDHQTMKSFMQDFVTAFGEPGKSNPFSTMVAVRSLYRVWSCNLKTLGREDIRKRWADRVQNDPAVRNWLATRALTVSREVEQAIVTAMNRGRSKHPAVTPEEANAVGKSDAAAKE